jgi:DNA-binding MarR family transcriptional regulator
LLDYMSNYSIDEKVMMGIVRVAELFKKESSAIFSKYGLTFSQYNILRALDRSEKGQDNISNIRSRMLVSGSRITGLAKRLEKKGLLIRKSDTSDERNKILEITSKGSQTLKKIYQVKEENLKKYLLKYSEKDKKEFFKVIRSILQK